MLPLGEFLLVGELPHLLVVVDELAVFLALLKLRHGGVVLFQSRQRQHGPGSLAVQFVLGLEKMLPLQHGQRIHGGEVGGFV